MKSVIVLIICIALFALVVSGQRNAREARDGASRSRGGAASRSRSARDGASRSRGGAASRSRSARDGASRSRGGAASRSRSARDSARRRTRTTGRTRRVGRTRRTRRTRPTRRNTQEVTECVLNRGNHGDCTRQAKQVCGSCVTSKCKACIRIFTRYCTNPEPVDSVDACVNARCNPLGSNRKKNWCKQKLRGQCASHICQNNQPAPTAARGGECVLNRGNHGDCTRQAKQVCGNCVTSKCKACIRVFTRYCTNPEPVDSVDACLNARCNPLGSNKKKNWCKQKLRGQCASHICQGDEPAPRDERRNRRERRQRRNRRERRERERRQRRERERRRRERRERERRERQERERRRFTPQNIVVKLPCIKNGCDNCKLIKELEEQVKELKKAAEELQKLLDTPDDDECAAVTTTTVPGQTTAPTTTPATTTTVPGQTTTPATTTTVPGQTTTTAEGETTPAITTVPAKVNEDSSSGLSAGAVVGIVVASAAAAGAAAVAAGFMLGGSGAGGPGVASGAPMASSSVNPLYEADIMSSANPMAA